MSLDHGRLQVAPAKPAEQTGEFGRAWRISHPDDVREFPATCGAWLVEQPSGHPFWRFHIVGAVHLRAIDGADPPVINKPGATHELLCAALDPNKPLPVVTRWEKAAVLQPLDWVRQCALPDDEKATELCELVVRYAIEVGLALDSDTRRAWEGIVDKTAEHYQPGGHP